MPLLLNIDTATENASVCISLDALSLAQMENDQQKEHASFLHTAIQQVVKEAGISLAELEAIAVTSGPGSYTGLRVGMATAKGLCYALQKPLITINTLEVMTKAAIETGLFTGQQILYCPMIDARRMEVFTALYDAELNAVLSPRPLVLTGGIFEEYSVVHQLVLFGSGAKKFNQIQSQENFKFIVAKHSASNLASLADSSCTAKKFADVAFSQPQYLKAFHSTSLS